MAILVEAIILVCFGVWQSVSVPVLETQKIPHLDSSPGLDSVESITASKILFDHVSPVSHWLASAQNPATIKEFPSPVTLSKQEKFIKKKFYNDDKIGEDMHFPLEVAQCRATCLEKFDPDFTASKKLPLSQFKGSYSPPGSTQKSQMIMKEEKLQHLSNIWRLERKRRAARAISNLPTLKFSCLKHSSECLTCWESCQLLETKTLPTFVSQPASISAKENETSNRTYNTTQCLQSVGCQVATAFYRKLAAKNQNQVVGNVKKNNAASVVKRHENVVKILSSKITWPKVFNGGDVDDVHVVYVVVQEYPDKKWRQMTQTTEEVVKIDNPKYMASGIEKKLGSVRVFVVGVEGLRSLYTSSTTPQKENGNSDMPKGRIIPKEIETSTGRKDSDHVREAPFELHVVSLIHQNSLVIAELSWNRIASNLPSKPDYMVTWEINGGGLKGHLVTDTTSVTLSLWPETNYHVQVEQVQQNMDPTGELPVQSLDPAIKSGVLVVHTSLASFPPSSALNGKFKKSDVNKDNFPLDENKSPSEKFIRNENHFPSDEPLEKLFLVILLSCVLVFGSLLMVAFLRTQFGVCASSKRLEAGEEVLINNGDKSCLLACFKRCGDYPEQDTSVLLPQNCSYSLPKSPKPASATRKYGLNKVFWRSCLQKGRLPYAKATLHFPTHHAGQQDKHFSVAGRDQLNIQSL